MFSWSRILLIAAAISSLMAVLLFATAIPFSTIREPSQVSAPKEKKVGLTPFGSQLVNIKPAVKLIIPTTKQACIKAEGYWGPQGLPGGPSICSIRTTDRRKICTDSSQCQGACLVADDIEVGSTAIGSCAEWDRTYGCNKFISDGKVVYWCGH
jgi:hypothetical protein